MSDPRLRIALALGIGAVGAFVAHWLHLPLAFMLGSLFATMAASLSNAPIQNPHRLRSYCLVIVGLFLSEGFGAEIGGEALGWLPSLLLAVLYPALVGAACYRFYRLWRAFSPWDALFSAIPGGLSGVVLVSGAFGADERRVALSHALRVSMIVLAAPAFFFGVLGFQEPPHGAETAALISWGDAAILAAAAICGVWGAGKLGVPLPQLLAPLAVGAVLRLTGAVDGALPNELVEAALVVVGASIGARFAGVEIRPLLRLAAWTVGATALMVLLSALFALVAAWATGASILAALLAFAPGGVAEMTLIAIALDIDPAYVAAHHLARIGVILIATPIVAPFLQRWLSPRSAEAAAIRAARE
ncbi:MAG: AbrB family transcriptional regulator [Neomegalonema sp.]|nr:AbrB family transcriptional regulator [Neomegalonema sp.]